jgi:hypothetical protein
MLPHRLVPNPWFCVVFFLWLAFPARFVAHAGAEPPRWVSASSVHSPQYAAEFAVDGDRQTRWASAQTGDRPGWLEVDFGREVTVDELVIHWERAAAKAYEIRVSSDRKTWQTIHQQPDGSGGTERISGLDGRGRYLRIFCQRPGSWGLYSIWELEFPSGEAAEALAEHRRRAEREQAERQREARQALAAAWDEHGVDEIVLAVRQPGKDGHWYANFSYFAEGPQRRTFGDGGRLTRLNVRTGEIIHLIDDPQGGVRDPVVHYDARKILFSYRPGGTEHYHLYEIDVDGGNLRQLTDGPYDDIEPVYLPDDSIVFVSSRCQRWVQCWLTQVAVLYRCDADGGNLRPLSANVEHDNTPWPLPDGRILYQRWEYVDRSQVDYHHLWTANPDGTAQMVFYGNQHPGILMIDAKPIPGTPKVVSIFSPGHGRREHDGAVTVVDPRFGPDDPRGATPITRQGLFRDPWAFSEHRFLAASGPRVVLLDSDGVMQTVYELSAEDKQAGLECHEPRPLIQRPRERVLPDRTQPGDPNGIVVLQDIYQGRNMEGIQRGDIKRLLVLESLPKPINFTGGMDPLTYGGSFTLARILGTVPVQEDGSAVIELPALRSLIFVALDENDMAVKRMHSFLTVQPGEVLGCVGCHEPRTQSLPAANPTAALPRRPSRIEPITEAPEVFDFPRDIQPVLDQLCVDCHGYQATERGGPYAGGIALSGDRGPMFSHAYFTMTVQQLFSDNRNRAVSNLPPRSVGSAASRILTMLDGSHHGVVADEHQRRMLRLWIEVGAPYPGTYAALGTGSIGGYAENKLVHTDFDWPTTQAGADVIQRRCADCHQGDLVLPLSISDERNVSFWRFDIDDPRLRLSRHIVFNLTRPEHSLLLLSPLDPAAGGFGRCRDAAGQPAQVFADRADPDYATLLDMVSAGRDKLNRMKRFDMPGFQPRPEYLRELRRYGVLPADHPDDAPVDPYQLDRQYWESQWYPRSF